MVRARAQNAKTVGSRSKRTRHTSGSNEACINDMGYEEAQDTEKALPPKEKARETKNVKKRFKTQNAENRVFLC